ncbi:MAG: UrcA family protein [Pseudomonadota bacterium]
MKILALSAAFAVIGSSAFAAAPVAHVGYDYAIVRLADLDISQPADARRLETRLETASMAACGAQRFSARDVKRAIAGSDCYRETLAEARISAEAKLAAR